MLEDEELFGFELRAVGEWGVLIVRREVARVKEGYNLQVLE